jgi:hypothetical protein
MKKFCQDVPQNNNNSIIIGGSGSRNNNNNNNNNNKWPCQTEVNRLDSWQRTGNN